MGSNGKKLGRYAKCYFKKRKNESSVFKIETFPPIFTSYFRFLTRATSE